MYINKINSAFIFIVLYSYSYIKKENVDICIADIDHQRRGDTISSYKSIVLLIYVIRSLAIAITDLRMMMFKAESSS